MDVAMEKAELRTALRALCRVLSPEQRQALSEDACARAAGLPAFQNASCLLAYKAMPRECDPQALVHCAWALGKRVAFPLCEAEHTLGLFVPEDETAFIVGSYGILEPDRVRSLRIDPSELDLIVVPGVGFDASCARLGQGGGYYDRLLQSTRAYTLGLAFPVQMVERIPMEALDRRVDAVATALALYQA